MARLSTSSKASKPARKATVARKRKPVENFRVFELGLIEYREAWSLQKELVEKRAAKEIPDTLLLLEHPPVITQGRKSAVAGVENLLRGDIPVLEIERGGQDTLHAPGQLVGYPIVYLPEDRRDLHLYMRRLEDVLIRVLADFGIEADRREGYTGVWVGGRKIASIGVACRKWVTYHGFALNVNNDLSLFQRINPCGLDPQVMTSLENELGCPVSMNAVRERAQRRFVEEFSS